MTIFLLLRQGYTLTQILRLFSATINMSRTHGRTFGNIYSNSYFHSFRHCNNKGLYIQVVYHEDWLNGLQNTHWTPYKSCFGNMERSQVYVIFWNYIKKRYCMNWYYCLLIHAQKILLQQDKNERRPELHKWRKMGKVASYPKFFLVSSF